MYRYRGEITEEAVLVFAAKRGYLSPSYPAMPNEENHMQVMAIMTGVGIFAIVGMLAMLPSLLSQARQTERDSFSRGGHSDAPWRSGLTIPSARPYRSPSF